ncbi:MAG: hypothetical protein A2X86_17180 [Bdellovibrionales bacterium GWA2_49_15]|nr:MAG: hypothetical protein A2X86_17180 [Bdellovibrionales bacterium GWA2_49_15]HAZ14028.1 hypothetical protein [Bdellovibrionales bacterium]
MKLLLILAFFITLPSALAGFCKNPNEILVSYPDDQSFCYLSHPLPTTEPAHKDALWLETTKAVDDLQQQLSKDNYKGSYNDLAKQLTQLYGNLDYAARTSGNNFSRAGRSFFETAILAVEGKKGLNAVNVKLAKIKNANNALAQSVAQIHTQARVTSCQADYEKRIRKLAKKSIFGPTITGALTGTSATLAAGLYAMSLGPQFPLWLANLVGREVYKLPFATIAPVAGWIGLGIGTATFIGYEGIILAKIIRMAQALDLIRDAQKGPVKKSFASKLGNFAKGVAKVRGWDDKRKQAIIAQAITTMDEQAMQGVRRGLLEAGPFEEGIQVCNQGDLPHKKDLINFLSDNPDYLIAQLLPPSAKDSLANGATKTEVQIEGCKATGGVVPGGNVLGLKLRIGGIMQSSKAHGRTHNSEVWNQPLRLSSNRSSLTNDIVKEFKTCLVPSRSDSTPKNFSLKSSSNTETEGGSRSIILQNVSMTKKDEDKEALAMDVEGLIVTEQPRRSYLETEINIALGSRIQIVQPKSDSNQDWNHCDPNEFHVLPEVDDEVIVSFHRRAIREQAEANRARRTFAGKKLFWMTHLVRPDLKKWKRIVTVVEIDKDGQEAKALSYDQCFPEEFQFPELLSGSTGNLMEEVAIKPVRSEIK